MQAQYQMQQAAAAAQYQAQFAQQAFVNSSNVQQQVPSNYGWGSHAGTPGGQRSSVYMDPYQQQEAGAYQARPGFQQSNRSSYYGGGASFYGGYPQQQQQQR